MQGFQIHPRLLIEALVTLTHAGWIALGNSSEKQFVITPAGTAAIVSDELPESTAVVRRDTFVLLERITGSVIPESEVRYVSRRVLRKEDLWKHCVEMESKYLENKLDESRVQHLIPRQQGQRLHWVGPIDIVSKGSSYIPIGVETESDSVINVPDRCERILRPLVLERAKQEAMRADGQGVLNWDDLAGAARIGRKRAATVNVLGMPEQTWEIDWRAADLLVNAAQHEQLLNEALEKAESALVISSQYVCVDGLERLRRGIVEALNRGVDVDILWSATNDGKSLEWMKKLAFDVKQQGATGRLRHNHDAASSCAKLLLWDEADAFRGIVGCYDWLGHLINETDKVLSVRVWNGALLSTLCWCVAGIWSGVPSEILSSVPDRWRRNAVELEAGVKVRPSESRTDTVTVKVVLDSEHLSIVRDWAASAQQRLLIASTEMDRSAGDRLMLVSTNKRGGNFEYSVSFTHSDLDADGISDVHRVIEVDGGQLRCTPNAHCNAIVSDVSVCISSFRFLSSTSNVGGRSRDIGLVVEGSSIAKMVSDALR